MEGAQETQAEVQYRDIPGCPGYRVGSDGSVWSCWKRFGKPSGRGCMHMMTDRWIRLKPSSGQWGHKRVYLKGMPGLQLVHRLVLEAFVGPCPDGMEACHGPDHDPSNNRLENLRWDTHSANMRDRAKNGTDISGEGNGQAKLTAADVRDIRTIFACGGISQQALADRYGVGQTAISDIVLRRSWRSVE